jgi:hypothetical protein
MACATYYSGYYKSKARSFIYYIRERETTENEKEKNKKYTVAICHISCAVHLFNSLLVFSLALYFAFALAHVLVYLFFILFQNVFYILFSLVDLRRGHTHKWGSNIFTTLFYSLLYSFVIVWRWKRMENKFLFGFCDQTQSKLFRLRELLLVSTSATE